MGIRDNRDHLFGIDEGAFHLNESEAQVALGFLLYRMDQNTRGLFASHLPHIYNKICERDVMAVAWRHDGTGATPSGDHTQPILLPEAMSRE